jgi:hypothetical protein
MGNVWRRINVKLAWNQPPSVVSPSTYWAIATYAFIMSSRTAHRKYQIFKGKHTDFKETSNCMLMFFILNWKIFVPYQHTLSLCGLVVRVLDYRSGGTSSIPGTTRKNVVGLERGPLSLVSTTKELLERKSSSSCLENREYGRRHPSRRPCSTLYPQTLAITSPTIGGRSVGIVFSQTQTMEFYLHTLLHLCRAICAISMSSLTKATEDLYEQIEVCSTCISLLLI